SIRYSLNPAARAFGVSNRPSTAATASRRALTIFFTSASSYSYTCRLERLPILAMASSALVVRLSASSRNFARFWDTVGSSKVLGSRLFCVDGEISGEESKKAQPYSLKISRKICGVARGVRHVPGPSYKPHEAPSELPPFATMAAQAGTRVMRLGKVYP